MPNYLYKAVDPAGKWLTGEVQGASREEAEARLRGRGLAVEALDEAESAPPAFDLAGDREGLLELVEQLAALSRAGLPLPSGLRAAGMELTSRSARSNFFGLADLLESGKTLEQALAGGSVRFPPDLRALVAAGARTGRLGEMLGEYVRGVNLAAELRRMFVLRLAYPLVALVAVVALVVFLCSLATKASAGLGGTMRDFGVDQSSLVQAMTGMAAFIDDHGWQIVAGLAAVPLLAAFTLRFGFAPAPRRRALCSIPAVGPVLRFTALTRFCHLMAMLIEAETPLPVAFEVAGSSIRDADVAEACAKLGRAVEGGEPLSRAMRLWETVPAGLGQLFQWSEDRGNLPGALHLAGDMFESRARSQSRYASNVIATLLFLLILWWLGFAIATLYVPLISTINMISKLAG